MEAVFMLYPPYVLRLSGLHLREIGDGHTRHFANFAEVIAEADIPVDYPWIYYDSPPID
jgi:hypothetical protein